jgi:hypothetical protein
MGEELTTSADGVQATTSGSVQVTAPTTDGQAPVSQSTTDNKEHERIIEQLRKENAAARKRLDTFEKAQQEAEAAKLSDQQKLEKKLADLQKAHDDAIKEKQELAIAHAVSLQAQKLGFQDPDDARRFLDMAALEFDGNGTPTNVESLLKDVLKNKPYLAGKSAVSTSGGATNPSRSASAAQQELSWAYITSLKPADWNAFTPERKQEIQRWQLNNPPRF